MKYLIIAGKFRRTKPDGEPVILKAGDFVEFEPEQAAEHIACRRIIHPDTPQTAPRKHRQGKAHEPVDETEGIQAPASGEPLTEPADIPVDQLPAAVQVANEAAEAEARAGGKVVRVKGRS